MPAMLPPSPLKRKRIYPGEPTGFFSKIVWHFYRKRKKLAHRWVNMRFTAFSSTKEFGGLRGFFLRRLSADIGIAPLVARAELAAKSVMIETATVSTIEPPCASGTRPAQIETSLPAVSAHVFRSAIAASDSAAIMVDGRVGVPALYVNHAQAIISERNLLLWHGRDGQCLLARSQITPHRSGVMLFAPNAANWYHWLFENLPAAFLTEHLKDEIGALPLIIPAGISGQASFRESLELFRNGREVVPLGHGQHQFDLLVAVDAPVSEPMNLRPGFWPVAGDYSFNGEVLRRYRGAVLDRLGITAPDHTHRLFLARGNGRRLYNQSELLAVAERYGFTAVYPERLGFREQVELLASAAFVVGPSGAAFANTLFCQSGTRLLSWLPPQYDGFCSYTNVASVTGCTLRYLFTTPDQPLQGTFDAFRAGYHVDRDAFEAMLRLALESPEY